MSLELQHNITKYGSTQYIGIVMVLVRVRTCIVGVYLCVAINPY